MVIIKETLCIGCGKCAVDCVAQNISLKDKDIRHQRRTKTLAWH